MITRVPGHPLTTILFIAVCWLVVINTVYRYPENTLIGIAIMIAGIPAYLVLAMEEQQMTAAREVMSSSYMNWAKTSSTAKFNLATSGLGNLKLRELRVSLDDLEITNGGYGYQPLIQSIANEISSRTRSSCDCRGNNVCKSSRDGGTDQTGRRSVVRTTGVRADARC